MKKIIVAAMLMASGVAAADVYVQGHVRKDGSYVQPHVRSNPDQHKFNNYSSQGNTNPYTGQRGTQSHEYSQPRGGYYGR